MTPEVGNKSFFVKLIKQPSYLQNGLTCLQVSFKHSDVRGGNASTSTVTCLLHRQQEFDILIQNAFKYNSGKTSSHVTRIRVKIMCQHKGTGTKNVFFMKHYLCSKRQGLFHLRTDVKGHTI